MKLDLILIILILIFVLYKLLIEEFFINTRNINDNYIEEINKSLYDAEYADLSLLPSVNVTGMPIPPPGSGCFVPYKCGVGYECDCKSICGMNGERLIVSKNQTLIVNGSKLEEGTYCINGSNGKCFKNLSTLIYSNNSWACRCKFPEYFDGPDCSTLVACNGQKNALWDFLEDKVIDLSIPLNLYEKMDNGEFRFRCKCDLLKDDNNNTMVSAPYLPTHCFKDFCKNGFPNSSVPGMDFINTQKQCNCGDFSQTRQKNEIVGDTSTPCSHCVTEYKTDISQLSVGTKCFNATSSIDSLSLYPCQTNTDDTRCGNFLIKARRSNNPYSFSATWSGVNLD